MVLYSQWPEQALPISGVCFVMQNFIKFLYDLEILMYKG